MGHSACSGCGHVPATWRPGVLAVLVNCVPRSGMSLYFAVSCLLCDCILPNLLFVKASSQSQKYAVCRSFSIGCSSSDLPTAVQTAILRQPAVKRALQLPVQSFEAGTEGRAWAAAGTAAESAAASSEVGSIDQLFLQVSVETPMCCCTTSEFVKSKCIELYRLQMRGQKACLCVEGNAVCIEHSCWHCCIDWSQNAAHESTEVPSYSDAHESYVNGW